MVIFVIIFYLFWFSVCSLVSYTLLTTHVSITIVGINICGFFLSMIYM